VEKRREIYSVKIKAGKRVYIFDVRKTTTGDYYITISERKKDSDGHHVSKQKIFLYKEDFNKFLQGLTDTIEYVKTELLPNYDFSRFDKAPTYYNRHDTEDEDMDTLDDLDE
jgi:hypothetical protein